MATSVPTLADIKRAEKFTRESFVHAGETTEAALAPGTARRRAFDAALLEIDAGEKVPSTDWRRRYSLMLGLERVLSDDEPKLADGTSLNPHQVDALSGTLTALLADAQRSNDAAPAPSATPVLAVDDEPDDYDDEPVAVDEDDDEDDETTRTTTSRRTTPRSTSRSTSATTTTTTRTTTPTTTTTTRPTPRSTPTSSTSSQTTPTPTSASGSSTRPAPARPSRRWASSTRRAPAASSSSPTAATSSTSSTAS